MKKKIISYAVYDKKERLLDTQVKQTKMMQKIKDKATKTITKTTEDEYGKLTTIYYITKNRILAKFIEE